MKILKKATQMNVIINKDYYTDEEANEMCMNKEACFFDKEMNQRYDFSSLTWSEREEVELRIFTDDLKEIKVALDNYGSYTNIAVGKNGKTYFVCL